MADKAASAGSSTLEDAAGRIFELNDNLVKLVKESGKASLDTFEKASQSLLDFEKAALGNSQLDWVNSIADSHVKLVEDVTGSLFKVARQALK